MPLVGVVKGYWGGAPLVVGWCRGRIYTLFNTPTPQNFSNPKKPQKIRDPQIFSNPKKSGTPKTKLFYYKNAVTYELFYYKLGKKRPRPVT